MLKRNQFNKPEPLVGERRSIKAEFSDFSAYLDGSLIEGNIKRYDWCPFCEEQISSDGFIVQRTPKGWLLYCHRCHQHKHVNKDGSLVDVRKALHKQIVHETLNKSHRKLSLPADFCTQIPDQGLLWLRQYGVTDSEIKRHHLGYSESLDRLILPVFAGDELIFWQGRRLSADNSQPKYLNMRASSRDGSYFIIRTPNSDITVVVEDIVSAIAVARAGYNTLALLGSYVNNSLCKYLPTMQVKLWLDPDKRKDSVKFSKKLRSLGYICSSVLIPSKDPKAYSREEILTFIEGEKNHEQTN